MKRILPWLFLMVICANRLEAQRKVTPQQPQNSLAQREPGKVMWTAGPETMPGNLKAFQENKGQFLNLINDWKILYGADYQGSKILFTDHGVIYTLPEAIKDESVDNNNDNKSEEEQREKKERKKIVYHSVAIEWENINANVTVDAQDETPYHFGSIDPKSYSSVIDNIKGFKKLVYHNVYPGIDVEYTFHKDKGVKYAIIVHQGYSASNFKMVYNGQQGLSIDANGDIHIATALGDIIDHAPVSSQNGGKVESSFRKINDNEIAFQLGNIDPSSDLIIDPWTVTPVTNGFLPQDVGMDGANNVYIMGGGTFGADIYVQKYTSGGALVWTTALTQFGTFGGYVSDMAVDVAGNTYVPGPYPFTNSVGNAWSIMMQAPHQVCLKYGT